MTQSSLSLFSTSKTPFTSDYAQKSQHQKSFNMHAIEYLAETIGSWFPETSGLSILDLCCGDGSSTQILFDTLSATRTNVNKLVGYDISPHQIEIAKKNNKNKSLTFEVMDAEKLDEEQRYDLIVSFFGLHWLEHIQEVVPRLHRALKADGRIVFLVPLEKEDLYQLRQQCIESLKWKDKFADYKLHPFHYTAADYTEPFAEYFSPEMGNMTDDCIKEFSKENFCKFLSSWLQEVRYLRSAHGEEIAQVYVNDLVSSIKSSPYYHAYLSKEDNNKFQFIERILFWQGKCKLEPLKTNEIVDVPAMSSLQSAIADGFIGFFKPKTFLPNEPANEKPRFTR